MSSGGFGQWYEQTNGGTTEAGSSWFDTESLLPMYSTEGMPSFSWDSMKASMEAQMPKKIMGMGYQQRFKVFCALLFLSALFFALAFFVGLPTLALHPQKFAISFSMGSLLFMGSFGILKGPMDHLKSMLSSEQMYFTFLYVGSMLATLYLTFTKGGISGYVLVMVSCGVQLLALLWYLVSFIPGGTTGLQYLVAVLCQMLRPVFAACARIQGIIIAKCLGWFMSSSSR